MSTTLGSILMLDQVVEIQAKCNVHLNKSYSPRLISKERWKNIHIYIVMFVLMKISMQYISFQYFQFAVSCIPPVSQNNSVVSSRRARFRSSSRAKFFCLAYIMNMAEWLARWPLTVRRVHVYTIFNFNDGHLL